MPAVSLLQVCATSVQTCLCHNSDPDTGLAPPSAPDGGDDGTPAGGDRTSGSRDGVPDIEEMEARLTENTQRVRDDIGNLASTIRDIETHFERVAGRIQAANARLGGRYDTVYQGWVRAREVMIP